MIKKFNEYNKMFEAEDLSLKVEVENANQDFINELIDKLSFVYKKRKDKYVRPVNITGRGNNGNVKLDIILSNKDSIQLRYKHNDELKIKINGDVLYHMDEIKIEDVVSKLFSIYSKYLKENNFKISKKDNPFETLNITESLLGIMNDPSYDEILKNTSSDKLLKNCFFNLDQKGVEYALKHGASKELYKNLFQIENWFLDMISDLVEKKTVDLDKIFWCKNDIIIFEQELERMYLWVNFNKIWFILQNKYGLSGDETQLFIKRMVERHLNLVGYKPLIGHFRSWSKQ